MKHTLRYLLSNGLISEESHLRLLNLFERQPLSIYWHIRILLYLGVTFISGALGVIIYNNIDRIGHLTIIGLIALAMLTCFWFAMRQIPAFATKKIESVNPWTDYLVLLGCLLFLTLEGYLQTQYSIFGERYGLATIIPAAVLFVLAYRFDHLGVLSIAITLFASWLGITLTPKELFLANDFSTDAVVYAGFLLCVTLIAAGFFSLRRKFKSHFAFTYYNFGFHVGAVAILGAAFNFNYSSAWLILMLPLIAAAYFYGNQNKSFYAILCAALYAYITIAFWFVDGLIELTKFWEESILLGYLLFMYFIGSAIYMGRLLIRTYKQMQK